MRFIWCPQAQSCRAGGLIFCNCAGGVGIGDRAHPTTPERITTVGIPPAVRLRLVLMPISLSCFSAASFYGLCPPAFLFLLLVFGLTAVFLPQRPGPRLFGLCSSNAALGVRPWRGLPQASGLVCSQSAENAPCERPLLL